MISSNSVLPDNSRNDSSKFFTTVFLYMMPCLQKCKKFNLLQFPSKRSIITENGQKGNHKNLVYNIYFNYRKFKLLCKGIRWGSYYHGKFNQVMFWILAEFFNSIIAEPTIPPAPAHGGLNFPIFVQKYISHFFYICLSGKQTRIVNEQGKHW